MRKLPLTAAEDLLEIIMRRYERASTLLTSNRPVEDWGKLLGDVAAVSCDARSHCCTMGMCSSVARAVGAPKQRLRQQVRTDDPSSRVLLSHPAGVQAKADVMSSSRHRQIYHPIVVLSPETSFEASLPAPSSDEFAAGYSLVGCTPAEPTSASPVVIHTDEVARRCQQTLAGRRVGRLLMMLSWVPINGRFWSDN